MTIRELRLEKETEILKLKKELAASDYKAIKYAEGEISATEYVPIREERRTLRARIRALETEINVLKG